MIKQLTVQNFTLFLKEKFSFGDKLNILIGENGNGKTQILKLLYALAKSAYSPKTGHAFVSSLTIAQNLKKVFHAELYDLQSKDHLRKMSRRKSRTLLPDSMPWVRQIPLQNRTLPKRPGHINAMLFFIGNLILQPVPMPGKTV